MSGLDKKFGWLEQWHLERLSCSSATMGEVKALAASFEERRLGEPSRRLYARLRQLNPSPSVVLSWLRHLTNAKAWSEVIDSATEALPTMEAEPAKADVYKLLVEALLERGRVAEPEQSDADRALHLLFAAQREKLWTAGFGSLLDRTVEAALPADLKKGRGEGTGFIADRFRDLSRLGILLGKRFGGRTAEVPHSEAVIDSAPALLAPAAVERHLGSSRKHTEEFAKALAGRGKDAEAAVAAAAISVGGLWNLAQIDNTVLQAMTFSSAGSPESFWRLREVADVYDGSDGALTRLSGYVAEQQVAADLAREGHLVEFPSGPTQPGWDLLVDGHPVQVKCSMSAQYVLDHFDRYPDIPVIVNAELAQQLGDHPMIWVDDALRHADVAGTTAESVDALADLADADDLVPIPVVAVVFAAIRNYGDLRAGNINEKAYAQRVGVDVAARTIGGGAGAAVGGAVGSVLGPVGTVLGMAIGSYVGSVAGRTGADAVNRDTVCDARDAVVNTLREFAVWFRTTLLRPRIAVLEARHRAVAAWAQEASAGGWAPACVATFYAASAEMLARAKNLDAWIAGREDYDDFARAQAGWVALREAGGFFHPELKSRLAAVREATSRYAALTIPQGPPSERDRASSIEALRNALALVDPDVRRREVSAIIPDLKRIAARLGKGDHLARKKIHLALAEAHGALGESELRDRELNLACDSVVRLMGEMDLPFEKDSLREERDRILAQIVHRSPLIG
ncbi:MAG: hypothetical protein IT371_31125 [Deltaproteobacteria bacterium]|nr:hypothetical protein [Deltaproteobacteria bacterium]